MMKQRFANLWKPCSELEGYQVTTAATGTEGTVRAGEGSDDVVLLISRLPDKSGMEVLADIRIHNPAQSENVMITAYGTVVRTP